jgi:hypothetical protein
MTDRLIVRRGYRLFLSFEEISIILFFNDEQITDDSWTQSD